MDDERMHCLTCDEDVTNIREHYKSDLHIRNVNNKLDGLPIEKVLVEREVKRKNDPELICDICGKSFIKLKAFTHHVESHENEKKYEKKYEVKLNRKIASDGNYMLLENEKLLLSRNLPMKRERTEITERPKEEHTESIDTKNKKEKLESERVNDKANKSIFIKKYH